MASDSASVELERFLFEMEGGGRAKKKTGNFCYFQRNGGRRGAAQERGSCSSGSEITNPKPEGISEAAEKIQRIDTRRRIWAVLVNPARALYLSVFAVNSAAGFHRELSALFALVADVPGVPITNINPNQPNGLGVLKPWLYQQAVLLA